MKKSKITRSNSNSNSTSTTSTSGDQGDKHLVDLWTRPDHGLGMHSLTHPLAHSFTRFTHSLTPSSLCTSPPISAYPFRPVTKAHTHTHTRTPHLHSYSYSRFHFPGGWAIAYHTQVKLAQLYTGQFSLLSSITFFHLPLSSTLLSSPSFIYSPLSPFFHRFFPHLK